MPELLIVDDEANIRNVVKEYAEFEGYDVTEASDGMEAVALCQKNNFDIIVMDIMMPRLDGYSACRKIKEMNPNIPIIMLSARGEEYDKLFGFETGIDDYVVKPFSPRELMARIRVVVARHKTQGNSNPQQRFCLEGLEVDMSGREVYIDGKRVAMTPKEYELLFFFIENQGIALSREKLLEKVWGYDFFGDDRTVDTHIKMLRNSLGPYRKFIVTVRGMGYKFDPTASEV